MTNELEVYKQYQDEHQGIEKQAQMLALVIQDGPTYEMAGAFLLRIKDMRRKWAEIIKPAVKAAHESHVKIKNVEKAVDEPLARAESDHLKPSMARWEMAEETRRREEQERVNRELRKQDEDRRLDLAEELEKSGKTAQANNVLNTAPPPEVVLPKSTDMKGISYRTRYYCEVVDMEKLVQAVAARQAPLNFVIPNQTTLNGLAASLKESVSGQWESWGLKLKTERTVSAGRG